MPTCRPLRICLLSSDYAADAPSGSGGGIETYVRLVARGLAEAGHDVHVIARATHGTHAFHDGRVHVHAIHVPDDWQERAPELIEARGALSFAWHARRKLRALIGTTGPFDVVEAPEYKGQGFFLARDADIPLVVKCHAHLRLCLSLNGIALTPDTALLADIERETLRNARAINANSRALASRCADDYGLPVERFAHVPYGIDTERFRPTPSSLRETLGLADARVALFVGRMEERKGITALVHAFARVAIEVRDAVLVLAGPDTNSPPANDSNVAWMRAEWETLGVPADRVRFLGTIANEDLPALYSVADVMVAPSAFEAFGLVYLEAMACGCPPIGCQAGGVPEVIVDQETGLLVPPDDPSALAIAMIRLLERPELRRTFAARGRELAVHDYSVPAMVARTERFYREAVA
jgi:glycosyltransferase involved in cell wall biosynthesis